MQNLSGVIVTVSAQTQNKTLSTLQNVGLYPIFKSLPAYFAHLLFKSVVLNQELPDSV